MTQQSKFYVEQSKNRRQPEYERLGVEPAVAGDSKLHDENGFPIRPGPVRGVQMPNPNRRITNDPVRVNAARPQQVYYSSQSQPQPQQPPQQPQDINVTERVPPPQPMAHVGMVDQMWTDNVLVSTGEKNTSTKVIDNNDYVDAESLQGFDPLNQRQQEQPNWVQTQPNKFPKEKFQLTSLKEGSYAVCFDGEVLMTTDNLAEVKSMVEDLLLRPGVNIDNLSIFKRMVLDFGVLLD
jgi:hypothetical protein